MTHLTPFGIVHHCPSCQNAKALQLIAYAGDAAIARFVVRMSDLYHTTNRTLIETVQRVCSVVSVSGYVIATHVAAMTTA